jgi:hypothetical protein
VARSPLSGVHTKLEGDAAAHARARPGGLARGREIGEEGVARVRPARLRVEAILRNFCPARLRVEAILPGPSARGGNSAHASSSGLSRADVRVPGRAGSPSCPSCAGALRRAAAGSAQRSNVSPAVVSRRQPG